MVMDELGFEKLFKSAEAPLRRALVAWYGPVTGLDATQAAWEWAWTHRGRLRALGNPAGYLFRVGQSHAKREIHRTQREAVSFASQVMDDSTSCEPKLSASLAALSSQQRASVLLVHGYGYSYREAAGVLGISLATLRKHLERGLDRLRIEMEEHNGYRTI